MSHVETSRLQIKGPVKPIPQKFSILDIYLLEIYSLRCLLFSQIAYFALYPEHTFREAILAKLASYFLWMGTLSDDIVIFT